MNLSVMVDTLIEARAEHQEERLEEVLSTIFDYIDQNSNKISTRW